MEHRGTLFWPQIEEEFTRRNARWWESHEEVPTVDFTVGSESMNQQVEMEVGLVPTLVGPLIDSFLQHLGKKIRRKLGSRRLAGLMSPASVFVPKELANYVTILLIRYGGKLRNSDDAANVEFNDIDGLKNVFAAERFDGVSVLKRRHFIRIPVAQEENQKRRRRCLISRYNGHGTVVCSEHCPAVITYQKRTKKLLVNYYVQQYDANGIALNANLQSLLNSGLTTV